MKKSKIKKGFVLGIIVLVIGSGILTIVPVMKADLTDGLVGYWSFDYGTAEDESGNGHDGIVYGATVVDGKSGNAFMFDGVDDCIDFGDDPDFDITDDITISLWFKTDTSQLGFLVSKLDIHNPDNGYDLSMGEPFTVNPSGTINFRVASNSNGPTEYDSAQTSSTFIDNAWYFLTAVYTSDGASRPKIYINAVEQSVSYSGSPLTSIGASPGYNLKIAEYSPGSGYFNFNGTLDEVRIHDRALTSDEIQALYDEYYLPPVANFIYSPANPINTDMIQFTDTSYDPDGTIVSWWWDFDDGYYSDLQNPIHCYYTEGSYIVTLTVTDDDGKTDTIVIPIIVVSPSQDIENLIDDIEAMDLHHGLENSLTNKLMNVIQSIGYGWIDDAINQLNAFINQVEAQRDKKLTDEQADYLVAAAQNIIDSL